MTPTLASALAAMAPGYSADTHRKVAKAMEKDMQAKHTEGPLTTAHNFAPDYWEVRTDEAQPTILARNIAREADARLYASAPDLLAALDELLSLVEINHKAWEMQTDGPSLQRARAAIAKAKGVRNG